MDERLYILIAKSLNNEASAEELKELEAWMDQNAPNRQVYQDMKDLWGQTDFLEQPRFEVAPAWEKVAAATVDLKTDEKGKTISFQPWLRAGLAAAVLLLVGTVIYLNQDRAKTIVAGDRMLVVELPDHSKVDLWPGGSLSYPEEFSKDAREVKLKGGAFFNVTHDELHPFIVDAEAVDVRVLGTSFFVSAADSLVSVTVATGRVGMKTKEDSKDLVLTPGQKGVYNEAQLSMSPDTNFSYYRQGVLNFSGVPFVEVLKAIGTVKNAIIITDPSLSAAVAQQLIDISFTQQTLGEMLNEICLITNTRWRKDGDRYIIYGR